MSRWQDLRNIESKSFICSNCNNKIASNIGYYHASFDPKIQRSSVTGSIYICTHCDMPTFFDSKGHQYPSPKYGEHFENLPKRIESIYEEIRNCFSVNAFTGTLMLCRRLISDISINLGADKDKSFIYYVDYLNDKNYIPTNSKRWVDIIRKLGNDVTHQEELGTRDNAKKCIEFIQMLLTLNYKFPVAE